VQVEIHQKSCAAQLEPIHLNHLALNQVGSCPLAVQHRKPSLHENSRTRADCQGYRDAACTLWVVTVGRQPAQQLQEVRLDSALYSLCLQVESLGPGPYIPAAR